MNVVAPPLVGPKSKKKVRYEDLLLFPPAETGDGKTQEQKRAEYEDIVSHVRGKSHKLGRGIKSEKTIAEIHAERKAKREHRREEK